MNVKNLILQSSFYLILGITLYFLLSLIIVHILTFLQQKVLNHQKTEEKPFSGYGKFLYNDIFSKAQLYTNTVRYIFSFNKSKFPIIENIAIERWVTAIKSLKSYLLPFIICGIGFEICKYLISKKITIDTLNVVLPKVQKLLTYINNFPILNWISSHKILFNFMLGILIILTPFLFYRRKRMKWLQKNFNKILIYIAILTNVTFFSGELSTYKNSKQQEIADIKFKIEEVHNRIYQKILVAEIDKEFTKYILDESNRFNTAVNNIEERLTKDSQRIISTTIRDSLVSKTNQLIQSIRLEKITINLYSKEELKNYNTKDFKDTRTFYTSNSSSNSTDSDIDYVFDDRKWTLRRGKELSHRVDTQIKKRKKFYNISFEKNSKKYAALEEIYTLVSSSGIDEIATYLPDIGNDVLKKCLKIISNYKKSDILKYFTRFFNKSQTEPLLANSNTEINEFKKKYNKLLDEYKAKERNRILLLENKRLKKDILTVIENTILNEIKTQLKVTTYDSAIEENIILNPRDYSKLRNSILQDFSYYRNDILKSYKSEINQLYYEIINSEKSNNTINYNRSLKNKIGNISTISKSFIKEKLSNIPIICPRCFMDMRKIKTCIPII